MTTKEISDIIKQQVNIKDVAKFYRFIPNKSGFINCPFHKEKTPSCKLYESSFYCFGCGAGGDVIKFVELLFGIGFKAALIRINTDFDLNIGLTTKKLNAKIEPCNIYKERWKRDDELKSYRDKYNKYSEMFRYLWAKHKTQQLSENELLKMNFLDDWLYNNPYR